MSKSKKIFLAFAIVFLALLLYASYDISRRTTFPGSKPQLKERIQDRFLKRDSLPQDSLKATQR
ncbi:MAG: hypothetical protein JNL53_19320 [Cyclobacteriaceae bacterium]|nr:hypothetical protein [Cyclobacteriaceae bacterium]